MKIVITTMADAYSLKGKNAIVTGGNRGIGKGISEAFAQQGANVAIFARDEAKAMEVIKEYEGKYEGKFKFYKTDITSRENCKASVDGMYADYGSIDILVNNSGVGVVGNLLDMDESLEAWDYCLNVDLNGAFRMCYFAGKYMRDSGKGGSIINISSNAGEIVNKPITMGAYSVAKAGLNRLTKYLAYELGGYGIRANAIAPGYTYSDMMKGSPDDEYNKALLAKMPIGRFGYPIEIGALSVYLASDASQMMTGVILTIDGGYALAI